MGNRLTRQDFIALCLGGLGTGLMLGCDDEGSMDDDGGGSGDVNSCSPEVSQAGSPGHTHALDIPASDVNAMVGMTYTTSSVEGHTHDVVLSEANFTKLMETGSARVETSSEGNHKHFVDITCS